MNKKKRLILILLLTYLSIELSSCSGIKTISPDYGSERSACYHQKDYRYTIKDIPKSLNKLAIDPLIAENFSFESLNVANAINLLDLMTEYMSLKREYKESLDLEKRIKLLELQQTITSNINSASLEISSVASELECEEERADQVSRFLESKTEKREKNLIISSIVIGAGGTIASESFNASSSAGNTGGFIAIGTSLIEAMLGGFMLRNNQTISFFHNRNTLREIWDAPETSRTLPPSIWYYFNYKDDLHRRRSLREILVENWKAYEQISRSKGKVQFEVYFEEGGEYTAEELKNRSDMYDQMEAYVKLMKQDLKTLSIEFGNLGL